MGSMMGRVKFPGAPPANLLPFSKSTLAFPPIVSLCIYTHTDIHTQSDIQLDPYRHKTHIHTQSTHTHKGYFPHNQELDTAIPWRRIRRHTHKQVRTIMDASFTHTPRVCMSVSLVYRLPGLLRLVGLGSAQHTHIYIYTHCVYTQTHTSVEQVFHWLASFRTFWF